MRDTTQTIAKAGLSDPLFKLVRCTSTQKDADVKQINADIFCDHLLGIRDDRRARAAREHLSGKDRA